MKRIYLDNGSTSFPKAPGLGRRIMEYVEEGEDEDAEGYFQSIEDEDEFNRVCNYIESLEDEEDEEE